MTQALLVSNVLLWLVIAILVAVVLALLRQIGILHERIAPAGALMSSHGPQVGEPAPLVDAVAWNGEPLQIGGPDLLGRDMLLVFVSPSCPVCRTLLPAIHSTERSEGNRLRVVLASDGPREEHEAFVAQHVPARDRYVLSSELGLRLKVGRLPHAVLIDAAGVLRAQGLVNSREHLESLFEARERGVASLQEHLALDESLHDPGQRVA